VTGADTNRGKYWLVNLGGLLVLLICVLSFNANIDVSKIPAYEASAVAQLRNIAQEREKFRDTHKGCFASELGQLPNITSKRHHYIYELQSTPSSEEACVKRYVVTASPLRTGKTNGRYFSIDETATIRFEMTHSANTSSRILQ